MTYVVGVLHYIKVHLRVHNQKLHLVSGMKSLVWCSIIEIDTVYWHDGANLDFVIINNS